MSKQVKTPRFYVDIPTFLHAVGYSSRFDEKSNDLLYMSPATQTMTPLSEDWIVEQNSLTTHRIGSSDTYAPTGYPINFCALLNHNIAEETYVRADATISIGEHNDEPVENIAHSNTMGLYFKRTTGNVENEDVPMHSPQNILNAHPYIHASENCIAINPQHNGTSIFSFSENTDPWTSFELSFSTALNPIDPDETFFRNVWSDEDVFGLGLGSFVIGRYWDAPNSPDLNLTMSRRFDGISTQKTIGGKTFSNIHYDGPIEWSMNSFTGWNIDEGEKITFKYPPFETSWAGQMEYRTPNSSTGGLELGNTYNRYRAKSGLGRKGLRTWKLSFSYISDDDMWMSYESSSLSPFHHSDQTPEIDPDTNGAVPQDNDEYIHYIQQNGGDTGAPMLKDDSFNFVWNCTLGGALPFIFQPDNENNNPDQFSICTFRENSLDVKQVAFNTYSVSVTIDEIC